MGGKGGEGKEGWERDRERRGGVESRERLGGTGRREEGRDRKERGGKKAEKGEGRERTWELSSNGMVCLPPEVSSPS